MIRHLLVIALLILLPAAMPATADPTVAEGRARRLVEALRSRWLEEREAAKESLVALGTAAESQLLEALRDRDIRVRDVAADLLGRLATANAVSSLMQALEGSQGEERQTIVAALVRAGDPARAELQRRLADRAEAPEALAQAWSAFLRVDVERELECLVTTRNVYGCYTGQFRAIAGLGQGAIPILWEMFTRPDFPFTELQPQRRNILRLLAGWALVDAGDPSLVAGFEDLLNQEGVAARLGLERREIEDTAALALWHLGRTRPMESLVQRLEGSLEEGVDRTQTRGRTILLLYRTGQYDRSERHLQTMLEHDPRVADWAHYCLACIYAVQNRVPEALTQLRAAVAGGYTDAEWIRLEGDLENLRGNPEFEELVREIQWLDRAAPKQPK